MTTPAPASQISIPDARRALTKGLVITDGWMLRRPLRAARRFGDSDVWMVSRGHSVFGVLYVAGHGFDAGDSITRMAQLLSIRQADILSLLGGHPRIPGVYTTFDVHGRHAFIRNYYAGPTLAEIVKRQGPIPWWIAARYALDVAWIIAYMQVRGVDNRDISPSNVLISGGRAHLFDFNVAGGPRYPFPQGWDLATGTPGYSPPEQLMQLAPLYGGDVWSLMATLYHMMTGQCPFTDMNEVLGEIPAAELMMRAESHQFPIPPLPDDAPAALGALVYATLSRPLSACLGVDAVIGHLRVALGLPRLRY